jgi:hypothetical protein
MARQQTWQFAGLLDSSMLADCSPPPRSRRPARVVSVSMRGTKARQPSSNAGRIALMRYIVELIGRRGWPSIDAVLFPGGFLRLGTFVGHLPFTGRARAIEQEPFFDGVAKAATELHSAMRGALLVFGADSSAPTRREVGDQLCIAVSQRRVIGLARKIYPTDLDTRDCARPLVPAVADFTSRRRFVQLPSGNWASLNSCYDLFGVTDCPAHLAARSGGLRWLRHDGTYIGGRSRTFQDLRRELLDQWATLVRAWAPDVALVAIHDFTKPGRDGYWQRHGIATASAALGGSLVVGAAHFLDGVPSHGHSPLAADRVPKSHLTLGPYRPAARLRPTDSFVATIQNLTASVRLFTRR